MSDTDNTYAMTARDARPTALGDLRFAGTIATGLVAGTLGLGAIALPLVGWKDWPQGLQQESASAPVQLAKLESRTRNEQPPRTRLSDPRRGGGATPITEIGLPIGSGGAAVGGGAGILSLGTGGGGTSTSTSSLDRSVRTTNRSEARVVAGRVGAGTAEGSFTGEPFRDPTVVGVEDDLVPDSFETAKTGSAAGDARQMDPQTRISVLGQYRVSTLEDADENGDGKITGADDSDLDGVPNDVEETNGTNPGSKDSDGDGVHDGLEDANGDGIPDGTPITPVPTTELKPPSLPVVPPVVEPPGVDGGAKLPVDTTPALPVEGSVPPVQKAPVTEVPASAPAPKTEAPVAAPQPTDATPQAEQPSPAPDASAGAAATKDAEKPKPEHEKAKDAAPAEGEKAPVANEKAKESSAAAKPEAEKAEAPAAAEAPAPAPAQEAPAPAPVQEAPAPAPVQEAPAPAPVEQAPAPAPTPAAPTPDPAPAPAQEAAPAAEAAADPAATPAW